MKGLLCPCALTILCIISISLDGHAAILKDSVDAKVTRALDRIYEDLYFVDYAKAAKSIDEQVEIAEKAGRWHMVVSALTLKAKCAYNHYLADKTYATLLQVEAIADKYRVALDSLDPVREYRSEIHYVRGMHFHEAGDFSRSINSFQAIIENQRRYKGIDPLYLYYVHSFIGHASLQLMLFDKAYLNYEEALAMLTKSGTQENSYQHAMLNLYKGQCLEYRAKNQNDPRTATEAVSLYKRALGILLTEKQKVSYRGALTSANNRLAAVSAFVKEYDSAIFYLEQSRKFQDVDEPTLSITYTGLANAYAKMGSFEQALELYNRAIAIAEKSYKGNHFQKGLPALAKAEMLLNRGDLKAALEVCQFALTQFVDDFDEQHDVNALPVIEGHANVPLALDALTLKGRIYFAMHQQSPGNEYRNLSLRCYQDAISAIQDAQVRYPDGDYRQHLAAKSQPLYEYALDAAFAAYESNEGDTSTMQLVFDLIESNKNAMLRDASTRTMPFEFEGVPNAVLESESLLKGSIASMRAQLYQSPNDTSVATWKRDLFKLTSQYDSVLDRISKDYPRYFSFRYGKRILPIGTAQEELPAGALLIEFFWGERSVYVLALGKSGAVLKKVAADDTLQANVRSLIRAISGGKGDNRRNNDASGFSRTSYATYKQLLEPLISSFEKESIHSLVIVPDGILSYVPFDILLTAGKQEAGFQDLPYLLKRYAIRTLFSAHDLSVERNSTPYRDPYVGFAPSYESGEEIRLLGAGDPLFPGVLSYNYEEVTTAARLFNGRTFVNNEASEENFRATSDDGRVLHLSMHGVVNDDDPSFSALLFAQPDSTVNGDVARDGQLYLHELYNIRADVELAVLSACETGGGRYANGEGIMSLGRAFRYAGCENIVMSLWKVNDNTTARLMKSFFQNLNRGDSKDEALRKAKLNFISDAANKYFTHPYYWSGFVLVGDTTPVFAKSKRWMTPILIFTFSALLVLMVLYFRRK